MLPDSRGTGNGMESAGAISTMTMVRSKARGVRQWSRSHLALQPVVQLAIGREWGLLTTASEFKLRTVAFPPLRYRLTLCTEVEVWS